MATKTKTKKSASSKDKNDTLNSSDHAWRYFDLHACQRISLIRYYVLLLSLYVTASGVLIAKFNDNSSIEEEGVIVFSIIFILITLVFLFLDLRNRKLIHIAEDSLRKYEEDSTLEYKHKVFVREKNTSYCTIRHTHCFMFLFLIAIISAWFIADYSWQHMNETSHKNTNKAAHISLYKYKNTTN